MEKPTYFLMVLLYILELLGRIFFLMFYLFLERGEGERKIRRETLMQKRNTDGLLLVGPDQGPNPQPRPGPCLGMEAAAFRFVGWHPANWATPVRAGPGLPVSSGRGLGTLQVAVCAIFG